MKTSYTSYRWAKQASPISIASTRLLSP